MNTAPLQLLQRYHRRALWCPAIWIAGATLAIDQVLGLGDVDPGVRLVFLAIGGAAALVSRWAVRRPLAATARWLDRRIGAQNRFEALAQCRDRADAMSLALADEAAAFARTKKLPWSVTWLGAVVALVGVCVFVLVRGELPIPNRTRSADSTPAVTVPPDQVANATEPTQPPDLAPPTAELTWITPEPDTRVPIGEDLGLGLEANSGTGLREFVLYVRINDGPWQALAQTISLGSGLQQADLALPLTALAPQPYDLVGYHVRAQRVRPADLPADVQWPTVVAPLQFVRLEPEGDALAIGGAADDELEAAARALARVRREQGVVVRDVFALQHELIARGSAAWTRHAAEALARQESVLESLASIERPSLMPPDAAHAWDAAVRMATNAAASLRAADVSMADLHAIRALMELGRAESLVEEAAREARARSAEVAGDAPKPGSAFDLDPRESTPAGRLERMAVAQATLAGQLAARETNAADAFGPQDKLARDIEQLAVEGGLPAEVLGMLGQAADPAREAAAQLNEGDLVAAIEPATRASQVLADAVAQMNAVGQELAAEELLHAQQRFIRAAADIEFAPQPEFDSAQQRAFEELARLAEELQDAAQRESARGSLQAAHALNELARAARQESKASEVPADNSATGAGESNEAASAPNRRTRTRVTEALMDLAERAAAARGEFTDRERERQRALQALKAARETLEKLQQKERRSEEVTNAEAQKAFEQAAAAGQQLGAGELGAMGGADQGQANGGGVEGDGGHGRSNQQRVVPFFETTRRADQPPAARVRDYLQALDHWVAGAIDRAERAMREARRAHLLTTGNPAEAPPAYRPAVSVYFESLAKQPAGAEQTPAAAR